MTAADEKELPNGTVRTDETPQDAGPWLDLIRQSEQRFRSWNERCDSIDKQYADLERLANTTRDRAMQLFWANIQTLGPSIYARPPVPVVMTRFKDRRPIPRVASELLERSAVVSFEISNIDRSLRLVRDDLARLSRGVVWMRYETQDGKKGRVSKKVCEDFKHRRDFVHDPARIWAEVDWVAAASYLSKEQMKKRFSEHSGDEYQNADYAIRKDGHEDPFDMRQKAKVWELWSKSENKVVWVAEGCEKVLEEGEPHLDLDGFFPCPEPAYGTLQPGTLIPVPDMLQYKDQLEEINQLTARISALSDAVKVRAFYPGGAGEIGDAIEAAIKSTDDNVVMVPVSNWAMLGQGKPSDMLVWLPIEMIVNTIAQLVELRRQLIQDVYEISGISDILRGQTDPNETLGAQELKAQTGSARIRDKQQEMVRLSRDIVRITAEVMAENYDRQTLLDMSQMDIPTKSDIDKQIRDLEKRGQAMQSAVKAELAKPEVQQMAQQNPEEAQKAQQEFEQQLQDLEAQGAKLKQTVTIEQVMDLLKDQRLRPFVLDVETDSTIAPDENAQKQRATEYVTAMTGLYQTLVPAVQQVPQVAPLAADMIKFANSQFRVGREFEQTVEEFAEQMKAMASAPKSQGPSPEEIKAQADAQAQQQRSQIEAQKAEQDGIAAEADAAKQTADAQRVQVENAERMQALQTKDAQDKQALAEKAAAAEQDRRHRDEAHAQAMELGNLKIEQEFARLENAHATTDATLIKSETQAAAPAGKPGQKRSAATEQRSSSSIGKALEQMANTNAAVAQALTQFAAVQAAPTVIDKDPATGKIVGARKVVQ